MEKVGRYIDFIIFQNEVTKKMTLFRKIMCIYLQSLIYVYIIESCVFKYLHVFLDIYVLADPATTAFQVGIIAGSFAFRLTPSRALLTSRRVALYCKLANFTRDAGKKTSRRFIVSTPGWTFDHLWTLVSPHLSFGRLVSQVSSCEQFQLQIGVFVDCFDLR